MVIFHSYVKLPEGKPSIVWVLCQHSLSGLGANFLAHGLSGPNVSLKVPRYAFIGLEAPRETPGNLSCGFSPGPMDLQILQWMTWNDPKFWIFCLLMPLKNRQLQKLTQSTSSQTASLRVLQVLFHPALLRVLALQQLGQLDAKTEMCVAPERCCSCSLT